MADLVTALVDTAIALAWSEPGASALLRGEPDAGERYEPWHEMDELLAVLDAVRPGWREEPPNG